MAICLVALIGRYKMIKSNLIKLVQANQGGK